VQEGSALWGNTLATALLNNQNRTIPVGLIVHTVRMHLVYVSIASPFQRSGMKTNLVKAKSVSLILSPYFGEVSHSVVDCPFADNPSSQRPVPASSQTFIYIAFPPSSIPLCIKKNSSLRPVCLSSPTLAYNEMPFFATHFYRLTYVVTFFPLRPEFRLISIFYSLRRKTQCWNEQDSVENLSALIRGMIL